MPAKAGQAKQRHMARFPEDADSEESGGLSRCRRVGCCSCSICCRSALQEAAREARAERGAGLGVAVLQVPGEDHALV